MGEENRNVYRNLGRTGVFVSPLCLGCMMFRKETEEAAAMDMVDHYLDQGLNFLDTANVYGRGKSEISVGKALARNKKRNRVVLATKVHGKMEEGDPNALGNSRRHIIMQCEQSLQRLQTDWIDLYQIHRPSSDTPIDETLRALDDLIRAGKVRYIGTSTFSAWQVTDAIHVARELGLNRFVCEQSPYHLLDRRIERELVPMAKNFGLAIIPWSPLAGGFLTGKYRRDQPLPPDSRMKVDTMGRAPKMFTDAGYKIVERLEELAKEKGCAVSQLALAWCMNQPGITAPIIGPKTIEQLDDNLGALKVTISDEDRKRIDEVSAPGRVIVPYYDADWAAYQWR